MKKILLKQLFISLLVLGGIFFSSSVLAEENIDYSQLYNQGVSEGFIKPDKVSLVQWLEENKEYKTSFDEGKVNGTVANEKNYGSWIKENAYGHPKDEYDTPQEVSRGWAGGFLIQKGDIIVTNATSSGGFLGHAAIANGNEYILDIPGPGSTTRQLTSQKWLDNYAKSGRWVKVYRMRDLHISSMAANWADKAYYSSKGTATQDRRPSYGFTSGMSSTNPTYCSKIVYQAYYHGTGNYPVMKAKLVVTPYDLIGAFNSNYTPYYVKYYGF